MDATQRCEDRDSDLVPDTAREDVEPTWRRVFGKHPLRASGRESGAISFAAFRPSKIVRGRVLVSSMSAFAAVTSAPHVGKLADFHGVSVAGPYMIKTGSPIKSSHRDSILTVPFGEGGSPRL